MLPLGLLGLEGSVMMGGGIIGLICSTVLIVHAIHHILFRSAPPREYTLYLRKLRESGDKMLGGSECKNIFTDEYNLLTDLRFPLIDFCVMKHLDRTLPMLAKQEQLHAKMHNEAKGERKRLEQAMGRWAWFVAIDDFLLLRSGKEIGCAMAGHAEATSGTWLYWQTALPCTKGFMSDVYVYHALEELEHGPLTTEYLRTQIFILTPLLVLPAVTIVYALYFLSPPMMVILMNPALLLRPKTFVDMARYYCTFIPTFVITMYACIMYWVLPFAQSHASHMRHYEFFKTACKERGISFQILDTATYSVRGKVVKTHTTHKKD